MIANVCERAAGRRGRTVQPNKQTSQQKSTATAMVRETLGKNSVTTTRPSRTNSNTQSNPGSLGAGGNYSGPSNLASFDSVEKSDAQVEAEAELELLMMQEEMSDLRIGASGWTQLSSGVPSQTPNGPGVVLGSERTGESEGGAVGVVVGGATSTAGVVGVSSQQLTVDSKEKERLEDIMAVAR